MTMARVTQKEHLDAAPPLVWQVITDLESYGWRSDLSAIEVLDEKRFIERDKGGFETEFAVTAFEAPRRYAFTMRNGNMTGCWTGILEPDGEGTMATFTEEVTAQKWFIKPFVGLYLKRQQRRYFADLRRALEQREARA